MPDLTSMVTDTLAKFSLSTVLSAVAILLICLVVVHLLSKLLRRLLAQTKLDERIQKYALAGIRLLLYIITVLIVAESLNIPMTSLVALPNKELASSQMTNYTVLGKRRVVQRVTASYDAPTETVKAACRRALEMTENLLEDPAPAVYLTAYKESSIEYTVYCWATPENWWGAYLALGEHLREAFREYGVEMTYEHLNVHIVENRT